MAEIGIAFAGGGLVAELHGRAVAACPRARFVGVFDPNEAAAEARVAQLGGKVYADLNELVADPAVDAVHVLTPPEGHLPSTLAALAAGKHVLLEKPVAETAEDIRIMITAAEASGRLLVPAHNYIHAPSIIQTRRLIDEGKLGEVAAFWFTYNLFHGRDLVKKYGSIYRVMCVHHAYSLLYLLGRPTRLMSMGRRGVHARDVDEPAQTAIVCEMPNGAIANLWASFASGDPTNDPWHVLFKVLGTRGGTSYSWNEACYEEEGAPGFGMPGYVDSFRHEVDFFVNQCVLGGAAPLSTMHDALDALRIIEAAERASDEGRTVEVVYDD